jgi:Flp pilus assembly protein TadG
MMDRLLPRQRDDQSGQALLEFVFIGTFLLVMAFGLIDFARALIARQVLTNVTREGANLASRGTTMTNALNAVITSAVPLNLNQTGYVILSTVYRNTSGTATVANQVTQGGYPSTSKIGAVGQPAALPNTSIPGTNETVIVAEVFYRFVPVTPLGKLLNVALPTQLYDVAFF